MRVLVIDVGGTHVKVLATGATKRRQFSSGPDLTPDRLIGETRALTADWPYEAVSIGFPGPVLHGTIVAEPHNLGRGWVGFDFRVAFGYSVKLVNDAAMQALGGYRGGKMLFLGLGTGLGTAMIVDGIVEPMEIGHLPYKKATYEDYVGEKALEREGKGKWKKHVIDVIELLQTALQPDEVLLGGGNVRLLSELPPRCRRGGNEDAFLGGFRLWDAPETAVAPNKTNPKEQLKCSSE